MRFAQKTFALAPACRKKLIFHIHRYNELTARVKAAGGQF
jgi:hypothetical protein